MKKAKSSLLVIGALSLITFVLVAGVLAAAQKKTAVVVAARALQAGTKLSLADVEVKQIHAGAALDGTFATAEEVVGLVITVQRMPGDQLTANMVGDEAQNALAQALEPGHLAMAIRVDQASGLAGLLRPGDQVSAVAIVSPANLGGMNRQATGPGAKVMLTGLKVLFVPYEFRYREISQDESDGMSPVMSSSQGRDKGVIVLSVPVQPITVTWMISTPAPVATAVPPLFGSSGITKTTNVIPTSTPVDPNPHVRVSPVELLALLDSQATIYLAIEPTAGSDEVQTAGIYLVDLLPPLSAVSEKPETLFVGGK